jgi:hypothetical protein
VKRESREGKKRRERKGKEWQGIRWDTDGRKDRREKGIEWERKKKEGCVIGTIKIISN